jgi:hypothetical protein
MDSSVALLPRLLLPWEHKMQRTLLSRVFTTVYLKVMGHTLGSLIRLKTSPLKHVF